jgi:hypothetical protein
MNADEVVKEGVQLFWSMRPDYECVNILETTQRLVVSPAECLFLVVLQEEVRSWHSQVRATHGNSVYLSVELTVEIEE